MKPGLFKKHAHAWLTIVVFPGSPILHWIFGRHAFANDAAEHRQSAELCFYLVAMGRDTFENWQSEFLQTLWQVCCLAEVSTLIPLSWIAQFQGK